MARAYHGRLLGSHAFGWKRVRDIEITRATEGDEPPVLMADGEYVGHLPVKVLAGNQQAVRLVLPAVAEAQAADSENGCWKPSNVTVATLTGRFRLTSFSVSQPGAARCPPDVERPLYAVCRRK